ncbi:MAG: hypothetical protein DRJ03_30465 [Chloroflexi bacterium]|nr:MAG: hypothetical protein DRJ03_30465 [Chloroflexota bacterium]
MYVPRRVREVREALAGLRESLLALLEEIRANPVLFRRYAPAIRALIARLDTYAIEISTTLSALQKNVGGW